MRSDRFGQPCRLDLELVRVLPLVSQHLRKDQGDLWTHAANYHSRTPRYNAVYRSDLMRKAAKWANWLEARFTTRDVTKLGSTPSLPPAVQAAAKGAPIASNRVPTSAVQTALPNPSSTAGYMPRKLIIDGQ